MASRNARFVGIYELTVRPARAPGATAPITLQALEAIHAQVKAARANGKPIRQQILQDHLYIILDDVKLFSAQKLAAMLFTVVDVDAADAVYRSLTTGRERRFTKQLSEAGAVSAHLVLKLAPAPNTLRYRVGLEDVEGVSRSRVLPFLEQVIRDFCGEVTAATDNGQRTGDAMLEMDAVHQDKLSNAAGRPIAVELVRLRPRRSLDPPSLEGFHESRRSILFSIDEKPTLRESVETLLKIRERQQADFQDYPLMRIRWKRPDNRMQTLPVDGLAEDLLQRAFTRMELISGITPDLPASMIEIRDDFVIKIGAIL